ncbi:unnamed protein product [Urochloa decumbens]|uniref:Uncharacterized protein n=1 Tax=Urochloa decumbens TaxID=240449 RepID=A0ABC8XLQ6_9POAL
MLRQSPSRSHRSKKLRPSHTLQAFLLVAVAVWIVYQLTRSYDRQRVVAVEADGGPARRWLGRKGFVDDIVGAGDGSDVGRGAADSSDDRSSQAGDDEDQEADGDDGVDSDADDVGGGLAADEEEDDTDFQSQGGSDEDELKTAQGQAQNGLNMTVDPSPLNATDTVQGGAAVIPLNATGLAADGTALTLGGSALNNSTSSSADGALHDRGTAGDVANRLLVNNGSLPGENQSLQINKNATGDATGDSVAGHGIP